VAAGAGRSERVVRGDEQRDAKVGLEAPDRGAQLGDVEPGRCAREGQLLGDGHEVAQQTQIGIHTSRV
jgi:hypothetical protein